MMHTNSRQRRDPAGIAPDSNAVFTIDPDKLASVRLTLLAWFAANGRDLPWRRTRDPYRILVSEVMLQQTQVDRVVPYYERFLASFPTVEALAEAPTSDVITAWAGLGYNRRAVNLQQTARAVVERFGGEFPRTVEQLRELPGIGPYTAGAVACFAFEQDSAFLDTNMKRVLHRVFTGSDVPRPTAADTAIQAIAAAAVPPGQGWSWNQGLIEFGALQCTARRPACVVCPLQTVCCAFPEVQTAIAGLPRGTRLKPEAPFTGSNRFYRGRVVDALRSVSGETGDIDLRSLGQRVRGDFKDDDLPWLREVVLGLARDGLAVAEESTPYDAGDRSDVDPGELRVRLPR